jgi:mono/diheme cytochrome c family protein
MATWQRALPLAMLSAAALSVLPSCRGDREDKPPHQFFPDLVDAPKWKPQTQTEFYADGRSMRQPVEGAVAYGRWDFDIDHAGEWAAPFKAERDNLLKEDDAFYRGVDDKGRYLTAIPIPVTHELIARGQERFNIYCSACHGYNGSGNGMVGQRWTGLTVANFHDPKYSDPREPDQKGSDGFFFHTALDGVIDAASGLQKMPPYRHALTERDAWGIVSYIRVLQQSVSLGNVPDAAARQRLQDEQSKLPPEAPPAAPTGATGATGAPAPSNAPKGTP